MSNVPFSGKRNFCPSTFSSLQKSDGLVDKFSCSFSLVLMLNGEKDDSGIGPLQVAIHVVQNHRTGEQKSHWDKTNKRHT